MTDIEKPESDKKSIPDLKVISGGGESKQKTAQEKRKYRAIHYNIAAAMAGERLGWHPFQVKLHRWVDHMGTSVPYEENADGIVRKVSDDRLHYLISEYWRDTITDGERPIYLGHLSADDLTKTRRVWLGMSRERREKFLCLGWKSDPRPALHKLPFDPEVISDPDTACPLFCELMSRTSNRVTLMAWIGSLFDEHSQRQQYAWIYGEGGNGKSALIRCLMNALGPVAASENPPTRDNKHWTCGLSNKRLVVFPDCNNVSFVTSGDFKQLTGEDPVRMDPKGKPVFYENIDAKFLIISNDKPRITSSRADLRRVLFFSIAPLPDSAKVDNYEPRLAAEVPAFLKLCWEVYKLVTKGEPRYEFVVDDKTEIETLVEDHELEFQAFVDEKLCVMEYAEDYPLKLRQYVRPQEMLDLMRECGFKTEYERRKLRDFMSKKHGVVYKSILLDSGNRYVFLNCKKSPP